MGPDGPKKVECVENKRECDLAVDFESPHGGKSALLDNADTEFEELSLDGGFGSTPSPAPYHAGESRISSPFLQNSYSSIEFTTLNDVIYARLRYLLYRRSSHQWRTPSTHATDSPADRLYNMEKSYTLQKQKSLSQD